MKNVKVLLAVNSFWNVYNFRLNLVKKLQDEGYQVILVAPYDEYKEKLESNFQCEIININNKGTNPFEDLGTLYLYYKLYQKLSPDVVLNFTIKPNIYSSIICNLLNIKYINNIAGLGTLFTVESYITKIAKLMYRFSQKKASTLFFQNRDDYQLFIENNLVGTQRINILPGSGVDVKKFSPELNINRKDGKIRFIHISRMIWEKGVKEYIYTAREIQKKYTNAEFYLLGFLDVDNPSAIKREEVQRWVREGIVHYLGQSDSVEKILAKMDCTVLASFYREGTPRVLLESASMGKPIITTDNVGCRDVVDDGVNGYLCKKQDAEDLKCKVEQFINLPMDEKESMSANSRRKVLNEYDESIVINQYIRHIKSLEL